MPFICVSFCSNLTNKYNPQEPNLKNLDAIACSNLTNKYNPQELMWGHLSWAYGSNLTNKYNPQERGLYPVIASIVQILPINTILKNQRFVILNLERFKSYQ